MEMAKEPIGDVRADKAMSMLYGDHSIKEVFGDSIGKAANCIS